mmetsp:Transcript_20270/g.45969  ORF Transcript_20270/g.45969 Transcript_20270/m.45969 type:complete len:201 (+) Transcript_20270:679-1281(+)
MWEKSGRIIPHANGLTQTCLHFLHCLRGQNEFFVLQNIIDVQSQLRHMPNPIYISTCHLEVGVGLLPSYHERRGTSVLGPDVHLPERLRQRPRLEGGSLEVVYQDEVPLLQLLRESHAQAQPAHLLIEFGGIVLHPSLGTVCLRSAPPVGRPLVPRPRRPASLLRPHLFPAPPLLRDGLRHGVHPPPALFVALIDDVPVQ